MSKNLTDLTQFVQDAIRTESRVDDIVVNKRLLFNSLMLFISAGQLLDLAKKRIFYRKPYAAGKGIDSLANAAKALSRLQDVPVGDDYEEETVEFNSRILHGIVGLATESTELCEALFMAMTSDSQLDIVNILEELGDMSWYEAILLDEVRGNWDEVLDTVILKLKKRYPEKFTNEHAINRDLTSEREVLETMKPKTE